MNKEAESSSELTPEREVRIRITGYIEKHIKWLPDLEEIRQENSHPEDDAHATAEYKVIDDRFTLVGIVTMRKLWHADKDGRAEYVMRMTSKDDPEGYTEVAFFEGEPEYHMEEFGSSCEVRHFEAEEFLSRVQRIEEECHFRYFADHI